MGNRISAVSLFIRLMVVINTVSNSAKSGKMIHAFKEFTQRKLE